MGLRTGCEPVTDLQGGRIGTTALGSPSNVLAKFVRAKACLKPFDLSPIGVGVSGPDRRKHALRLVVR